MEVDQKPSSPAAATSLPTGREVLVVEDEQRIRNMLSQALKQMGFNATLAGSAEAANRAMAQQSFDILMLDLNLPGMGGMDFLASLRRKHQDLQVIILTGFGDLESAKKAIHFDVVEFLTKPCTLASLEVALDRARKRRRGQIVEEGAGAANPLLQFEPEISKAPAPAPPVEPAPGDTPAPTSMEEIEQRHILGVLQKNGGNRAATAAELGISLRKLYYRLGEYQKKGVAIP
jgi:DNA-binding NtrC family response regulator